MRFRGEGWEVQGVGDSREGERQANDGRMARKWMKSFLHAEGMVRQVAG